MKLREHKHVASEGVRDAISFSKVIFHSLAS